MFNQDFWIGFMVAMLISYLLVFITWPKKETRFKKGSKRTILLARLGGYSRWDKDGKRYKK